LPCNLATNVVRPLSLSPKTTIVFVAGTFLVDDFTSRNIDALEQRHILNKYTDK